MIYEHTQRSPLWLLAAGPIVLVIAVSAAAAEADTVVLVVTALGAALIIALLAIFSWLTIRIGDNELVAAFGRGWPRKRVDLGTVQAAAAVRNAWYYGWGIRWIPRGSLWNVWGLDAVELSLDSGRVVRIGTDDVDGLLAALSGRIGARQG